MVGLPWGGRRLTALQVLVAGAAAAILLTLAYALGGLSGVAAPDPVVLGACTLTTALSVFLRLDVRVGAQRVVFVWLEAAVVLALFLLPGAWLTVSTFTAVVLAQTAQRYPPSKVVVNTASATVGAALAAVIYAALAGHGPALTVVGAVAAAGAFTLVSDLTVSTAIALTTGVRVRSLVRDGLGLTVVTTLGNVTAALGVLALLHWEPKLLLALPPLLVALHSAYRHRRDAQLERETWAGLSAATSRLATLRPEAVVSQAAVDLAVLFGAALVEVEVTDDVLGRVYACGGRDGPLRPPERPASDLVRALADRAGAAGQVRMHFGGAVALTAREEASLSTYVSSLLTAVRNANLHRRREYEAEHDPLTGLANRTLLAARVRAALQAAPASGEATTALLLIDLDHFKQVNDALGHEAGDDLLRLVSHRLSAAVGAGDLVARLGGDEFAVLVTGLPDERAAVRCATALLEVLAEPLRLGDLELRVEASVGVAPADDDASDASELLRRADVAMYQAKREGTGVERYDPLRDQASAQRLGLLGELRGALDGGQLILHYQRKEDLVTGEVVGAEALVRWQHPRRGLVFPGDFVPDVEASALVGDFTLHVLDLALGEAARWEAEGYGVPVAVNLSARLLIDAALPLRVADLLRRRRVPARRLVLEVTETVAKSELEVVGRVLDDLHRLGVRLSVDDFGTGYSSMTFLTQTALHEVKIDRSFVAGMLGSPGDAAIVRATVELARGFGLSVVAEGIETHEQRDALVAAGCRVGQGYLLGRPVPAEQFRGEMARDAQRRLAG